MRPRQRQEATRRWLRDCAPQEPGEPLTGEPGRPEDTSVLLVDGRPERRRMLEHVLRQAGFTALRTSTHADEVIELCFWSAPDLILLDLELPPRGGVALLEELQGEIFAQGDDVTVIGLADAEPALAAAPQRALAAGVRELLVMPVEAADAMWRVHNQLRIRARQQALLAENRRLEERLRHQTELLRQSRVELVERLARAGEFRDDDTGRHNRRVAERAAVIADELGLEPYHIELIWRGALLHDLGKIGVADAILHKPAALDADEMRAMRAHTTVGADILAHGSSDLVRVARLIALTHHEWWDGSGYAGLAGEAIPIEGRIVAAADVFDALVHERPYKQAWPVDRAVELIVRHSGRQFDPRVVDAFLSALRREGLRH